MAIFVNFTTHVCQVRVKIPELASTFSTIISASVRKVLWDAIASIATCVTGVENHVSMAETAL